MHLRSPHLAMMSRLFSISILREIAENGRSPRFTALLEQSGLRNRLSKDTATIGSVFEEAFRIIKKNKFRNEYTYRYTLIKHYLSLRRRVRILAEFRAGFCKADLVIVNDSFTAFEIKTERDSLQRLKWQIENYQKIFPIVYVLAAQRHEKAILNTLTNDIGIMVINAKNGIEYIRKATERIDLMQPLILSDSLRKNEALALLENLKGPVPNIPNTQLRTFIRNEFSAMDPIDIYKQTVNILKKRKHHVSLADATRQVPKSLLPAVVSMKMHHKDYTRFIETITLPLEIAKSWT